MENSKSVESQQIDVTLKLSFDAEIETNKQLALGTIECVLEQNFKTDYLKLKKHVVKTYQEEKKLYEAEGNMYLATFEVTHGETSNPPVKHVFKNKPSLDPLADFGDDIQKEYFEGIYSEEDEVSVYTASVVAIDKDEYEVLEKFL